MLRSSIVKLAEVGDLINFVKKEKIEDDSKK